MAPGSVNGGLGHPTPRDCTIAKDYSVSNLVPTKKLASRVNRQDVSGAATCAEAIPDPDVFDNGGARLSRRNREGSA